MFFGRFSIMSSSFFFRANTRPGIQTKKTAALLIQFRCGLHAELTPPRFAGISAEMEQDNSLADALNRN